MYIDPFIRRIVEDWRMGRVQIYGVSINSWRQVIVSFKIDYFDYHAASRFPTEISIMAYIQQFSQLHIKIFASPALPPDTMSLPYSAFENYQRGDPIFVIGVTKPWLERLTKNELTAFIVGRITGKVTWSPPDITWSQDFFDTRRQYAK